MSEYPKDDLHLQFIALLLHDLETPLAVAKQFLSRVESGRFDPEQPRHMDLLASTRQAVDRAERILQDVLDQARQDIDVLKPKREKMDLRNLFQECLDVVQPLAVDQGVKIVLKFDTQLPEALFADSHLTSRVIDNLLVNALRHAPHASAIDVSISGSPTAVRIEVRNRIDAGSEYDPAGIFDPVKMVQLRREGKIRGQGLGLSFCRMVVIAQGGKIGAERESDNCILFWFELPVRGKGEHNGRL